MAKSESNELTASCDFAPANYEHVLNELTALIGESRRQTAAYVNRELVMLYWQLGAVVSYHQVHGQWGDAVVDRLAAYLRMAFPDLKGFTKDNLFRMRKFATSCSKLAIWLEIGSREGFTQEQFADEDRIVGTVCPQLPTGLKLNVGTVCPQVPSSELIDLVLAISWSHHRLIIARCQTPAECYFYMKMSAKERWSVRELRRQIDSVLFARYTGVKDNPERCLPDSPDAGDLLPFRDHYVLEFLGLEEEHTEKELRHAILSKLRDFFLEFGRDLTFVGEEYPITVGNDTFSIDLLFFHRRLQCLIAVDLKKGEFKPEYVGKSCFYCAAADEHLRLEHEKPTLGLVLCKSADSVQVRLALTEAASRVGVATYQTGLPDEQLIQQRIAQLRFDDLPDDPAVEKSS